MPDVAESHVFARRQRIPHTVLEDHRQPLLQRAGIELSDVDTVDEYPAPQSDRTGAQEA